MLTVTNMYRLSITWMLSDFTNPVGKILLLITQEQVGNCCSDVNGVILDRHQYRREHNLAPWMLPTKAWLYYDLTVAASLTNWCLIQLPRKSMWAFALIKMLFSRPSWQPGQISDQGPGILLWWKLPALMGLTWLPSYLKICPALSRGSDQATSWGLLRPERFPDSLWLCNK